MKQKHSFDTLMGLLLLCLFTTCLLMVLLVGAQSYRGISSRLQAQYGERTVLDYLTVKLRHYDAAGSISLGELDGIPVLQLEESIEGERFITYLYAKDGYLWELFAAAGDVVTAEDGLSVLPVEELSIEPLRDHLLRLRCSFESRQAESLVALMSGGFKASS